MSLRRGEGRLAKYGPLVVETGKHTGRSANDKFIVRDEETEDSVWWGKVNVPMEPAHFAALKEDFLAARKTVMPVLPLVIFAALDSVLCQEVDLAAP